MRNWSSLSRGDTGKKLKKGRNFPNSAQAINAQFEKLNKLKVGYTHIHTHAHIEAYHNQTMENQR